MKAIVIPQYTQRLMVGTFVAASFFATTVQANAAIQQPELDNSAFILIIMIRVRYWLKKMPRSHFHLRH